MIRFVVVVAARPDALAAVAGVLEGKGAARHREVVVGLDAGGAGVFGILVVVGHAAGGSHQVRSAFDQHIFVGGDALGHVGGDRDHERAVRKLDIVLALEAVAGTGARVQLDGRIVHQADVVVGGDAGLALRVPGIDGKQAVAAEDELAFAEEHGLVVLVILLDIGGGRTVGERVRAFHHDIRAFLALVVDGGAVGIGNADAVQDDGLFLGAVHLEEAVFGRAGKFVDEHFAFGIVDRDLVAIDGNIAIGVALDSGVARLREGDLDPSFEFAGGDVVVRGRIAGGLEGERTVALLAA